MDEEQDPEMEEAVGRILAAVIELHHAGMAQEVVIDALAAVMLRGMRTAYGDTKTAHTLHRIADCVEFEGLRH